MPSILDRSSLWAWVLEGVAFISCLLVGVNMYLFSGNQSSQREVGERQQFIAQSVQLQAVGREVVTALGNLAMRNNDEQLKEMLKSHGIIFSDNRTPGLETKAKAK